jgi:peptide-methionine (S)-S-oxide reductase
MAHGAWRERLGSKSKTIAFNAMRHALCAMLIFSAPAGAQEMKEPQKAAFAGGCFWGLEKYFGEQTGVLSTRVGYTGGHVPNPGYELVCTGKTGHAEAVEVTFDSAKTSYENLLEFFFTHHNPTTLNRQGNDVGTQYRSAIFYYSPEQKDAAQKAKDALGQSGIYPKPIVTEVEPAAEFYAAEEYHQKYLKKNPGGYCEINLQPEKVREVLRSI